MTSTAVPVIWSSTGGTEGAIEMQVAAPTRMMLLAAGALTASCLLVVPNLPVPTAFMNRGVTTDDGVASAPPSAPAVHDSQDVAEIIRQTKVRSGLTWDQLAEVFGVSRRAVHGWAAGARMNARHAETLAWLEQLLARVEESGDPDTTRAILLQRIASMSAELIDRTRPDTLPLDRLSVRRGVEKWRYEGESVALVDGS